MGSAEKVLWIYFLSKLPTTNRLFSSTIRSTTSAFVQKPLSVRQSNQLRHVCSSAGWYKGIATRSRNVSLFVLFPNGDLHEHLPLKAYDLYNSTLQRVYSKWLYTAWKRLFVIELTYSTLWSYLATFSFGNKVPTDYFWCTSCKTHLPTTNRLTRAVWNPSVSMANSSARLLLMIKMNWYGTANSTTRKQISWTLRRFWQLNF